MKNLYYYKNTRRVHYDSRNGTVTLSNLDSNYEKNEIIKTYTFEAILGILEISSSKYLFFIKKGEEVGHINDSAVNRIISVGYISLLGHSKSSDADIVKNFLEDKIFYYTSAFIKESFEWNKKMKESFLKNFQKNSYNSFNYNERNIQRNSNKRNSNQRSPFIDRSPFLDTFNTSNNLTSSYNSNSNNLYSHNPNHCPEFELTNLFCGYFELQKFRTEKILTFEIQSLISTEKIGPRMLSRGVDFDGNVSFFVKTTFRISDIEKELFSFEIFRGSVPLFWSQSDPLKPNKIEFDKSENENFEAFKKHFEKDFKISHNQSHTLSHNNQSNNNTHNSQSNNNINNNHTHNSHINNNHINNIQPNIFVIDLLSEKKYEKILSQMYKNNCKKFNIKYLNFNLNKYTNDYNNLKEKFYRKLSERIIDKDIKNNATNNATNYVKFEHKKFFFFDQSSEESNHWDDNNTDDINDNNTYNTDDINDNHFNNLILQQKFIFRVNCLDCLDRTNLCQFLLFNYFNPYRYDIIKQMWKNNGDALSKMYTGSDALKGELSKNKKLTLVGRMNDIVISANRMINNKFTDKEKQRAIDLLLNL